MLGLTWGIPINLRIPSTKDELLRRLDRELQVPTPFGIGMRTGLAGRLSGATFRLTRYTPMFRNSFQPVLYGEVVADGPDSLIRGEFKSSRFVQGFLPVCYGFMVVMVVIDVIIRNFHGIVLDSALLAGIFGIAYLGKWLARNDPEIITELLTQAMHKPLIPDQTEVHTKLPPP